MRTTLCNDNEWEFYKAASSMKKIKSTPQIQINSQPYYGPVFNIGDTLLSEKSAEQAKTIQGNGAAGHADGEELSGNIEWIWRGWRRNWSKYFLDVGELCTELRLPDL